MYTCMCAYHGMYLEITGQLAGVKFIPSTMGIPGDELRSSGLVTSTFTSGGRREVTPSNCLPISIHYGMCETPIHPIKK